MIFQHQLKPHRIDRFYIPQDNGDLIVRSVAYAANIQLVIDVRIVSARNAEGENPNAGEEWKT